MTGFGVLVYKNEDIGVIAFSSPALHFKWNKNDNYKAISLIHEKSVFQRPYLICLEGENPELSEWNNHQNTFCTLNEFLSDFPNNIIEVQMRSLMLLHKKYPKYGFQIAGIQHFEVFAEDFTDFVFILETMMHKNLIQGELSKWGNGQFALKRPLVISETGWMEIQRNLNQNYSRQVFIAMSFAPEMNSAYLAIQKAILELDYIPVRIDKKEHNKEISGEILNEIKNSYFVIADVTGQRNGVYFEAGFAMGHNKPVIWCCSKKEEDNIHFDTRQYNHIFWEDEQQLYEKLKDRILGSITVKE
jgi:hypothetical protein